MTLPEEDRLRLRAEFDAFAADDNEDRNPVYAAVGSTVATNRATLELFDRVEEAKRKPVTLLAAVHYLILKGADHPLAQMYEAPEARGVLEKMGAVFVSFCADFEDEIVEVMKSRTVQTNEVNRSIGLMPALMEVTHKSRKSLALVELGTSAGLNLLFDRFRYDYVGGGTLGPPGATVRLSTQLRGKVPRLNVTPPLVEYRIGVDLDPISPADEDAALWLRACIWVGEVAREQRLTAALSLAKREWQDVVEGNAVSDLHRFVDHIDPELELCIYSSWMMHWLSEAERVQLAETIHEIAEDRSVWWVTFEGYGEVPGLPEILQTIPSGGGVLGVQHITGDNTDAQNLALMHFHGAWLDWLDQETAAG